MSKLRQRVEYAILAAQYSLKLHQKEKKLDYIYDLLSALSKPRKLI